VLYDLSVTSNMTAAVVTSRLRAAFDNGAYLTSLRSFSGLNITSASQTTINDVTATSTPTAMPLLITLPQAARSTGYSKASVTAIIVGSVVGSVVICFAVAALCIYCFCRQKFRNRLTVYTHSESLDYIPDIDEERNGETWSSQIPYDPNGGSAKSDRRGL
jgi:hypothetical protein